MTRNAALAHFCLYTKTHPHIIAPCCARKASEAQMDLLMHTKERTPNSRLSACDLGLPYNSKVFVMAGGEGFWYASTYTRILPPHARMPGWLVCIAWCSSSVSLRASRTPRWQNVTRRLFQHHVSRWICQDCERARRSLAGFAPPPPSRPICCNRALFTLTCARRAPSSRTTC